MAVMTKEEAEDLHASWLLVEKHIQDNGLRFFVNLFTKHPDIQMKNFPTMGVNDLQRLRDHGTGVLRDVEMMVMFVKAEDDEQLIAKIHKVTQNHYRRGINTIASYKAMNAVLLETLSQVLGPKLTPAATKAWTSLLDVLTSVVNAEIKRLDEEAAILLTEKIKARKSNDVAMSQ